MSRLPLLMLCVVASGVMAPALAASASGTRAGAAATSQSQQLARVEGAWIRGAVAGQHGTGAFMRIMASRPTRLVGLATPVAGTAEIHEMKMEGDVMRMRAVPALDLPAGRTIELRPGGYHVMLLDLKQALKPGSTVPLTLVFRDAGGAESRLELEVPVAMKAPGARSAAPMDSHKH